MNAPGVWLLTCSRQLFDEDVVESAVVPAVADLQYEVLGAGDDAWRRWLARARGYVGIVRCLFSLFRHGLIWRSPMRRLITVLVLGVVGSVLLLEILSVSSPGPAGFASFFLMAVLAPMVLRVLNPDTSYRQMFVNCISIALMMATVLFGWTAAVDDHPALPWHAYVTVCVLLIAVALGSALAAARASQLGAVGAAVYRRRILNVIASGATFAACYVALWNAHPVPAYVTLNTVRFAIFLGFFFAAVAVTVHLPVLLAAQRRIGASSTRPPLALLGALLFPIPLLGFQLFQGHLISSWRFLAAHPGTLALVALPYVIAGAVLGWLLAERRPSRAHAGA